MKARGIVVGLFVLGVAALVETWRHNRALELIEREAAARPPRVKRSVPSPMRRLDIPEPRIPPDSSEPRLVLLPDQNQLNEPPTSGPFQTLSEIEEEFVRKAAIAGVGENFNGQAAAEKRTELGLEFFNRVLATMEPAQAYVYFNGMLRESIGGSARGTADGWYDVNYAGEGAVHYYNFLVEAFVLPPTRSLAVETPSLTPAKSQRAAGIVSAARAWVGDEALVALQRKVGITGVFEEGSSVYAAPLAADAGQRMRVGWFTMSRIAGDVFMIGIGSSGSMSSAGAPPNSTFTPADRPLYNVNPVGLYLNTVGERR